jgi:hypothetical protein
VEEWWKNLLARYYGDEKYLEKNVVSNLPRGAQILVNETLAAEDRYGIPILSSTVEGVDKGVQNLERLGTRIRKKLEEKKDSR